MYAIIMSFAKDDGVLGFTATESSTRIRTSPLNNTASHCLVALHRGSFVPLSWHSLTMSSELALKHLH